jgi:hypothetical protein
MVGSVHARPSAWPPIDMSGNVSAHMSDRHLLFMRPDRRRLDIFFAVEYCQSDIFEALTFVLQIHFVKLFSQNVPTKHSSGTMCLPRLWKSACYDIAFSIQAILHYMTCKELEEWERVGRYI